MSRGPRETVAFVAEARGWHPTLRDHVLSHTPATWSDTDGLRAAALALHRAEHSGYLPGAARLGQAFVQRAESEDGRSGFYDTVRHSYDALPAPVRDGADQLSADLDAAAGALRNVGGAVAGGLASGYRAAGHVADAIGAGAYEMAQNPDEAADTMKVALLGGLILAGLYVLR